MAEQDADLHPDLIDEEDDGVGFEIEPVSFLSAWLIRRA